MRSNCLFLLLALPAFAADPRVAAAVQIVGINIGNSIGRSGTNAPGSVTAQVTLKNTSSGIITAYTYSVKGRYADGHEQTSQVMTDEVSTIINEKQKANLEGTPAQSSSFGPGQIKTLTASLPLASGLPPVSVTAEITMISLDDNSAVGDAAEITSLRASRKLQVDLASAVVGDLKDLKSSPDPKQRAVGLIAEFSKQDPRSGHFQARVNVLRMVSQGMEQRNDALDNALIVYSGFLSEIMARSDIREAK